MSNDNMLITLPWDDFYKVYQEQLKRLGHDDCFFIYRAISNEKHTLYSTFFGDISELQDEVDSYNHNTYQYGDTGKFYPIKTPPFELIDLDDLAFDIQTEMYLEIVDVKVFTNDGFSYVSFKPVISYHDIRHHFLKVMMDVL